MFKPTILPYFPTSILLLLCCCPRCAVPLRMTISPISISYCYLAYQSMNRRISKATTNYQNHKFASDHLFKKQSCNQEAWRIFSSEPPTALDASSRTLSLFFENPQFLLGCRRLEHYSQAQRLREGVCVLMRGKIRVLLCKQARNAGKMEIEHAIFKMENRTRSKCCIGYNKLNIIEVNQPYQIVMSSNNCLAMPGTSLWFIPAEELADLQFYDKLKKLRDLLSETSDVFQVDSELPFIYRHLIFSFRSEIILSTDIEVAIIKKGDVMVQWVSNPLQKLIVSQGSVIHKSQDYHYYCHSSEVELIGVRANNTFKFVAEPIWTKRPATGTPVLPKEESKEKILLFRSRSKNLERLTSSSKNRKFFKQTKSLSRSSSTQNKQFASKSAIYFGSLQSHKQKWLFMRKIQGYQVASNTRSQIQYKRIDALRQRFKKENVSPRERHEALLCKKVKKNKISFSHLPSKKGTIHEKSHLFDSVSNFFKKQMSHHH